MEKIEESISKHKLVMVTTLVASMDFDLCTTLAFYNLCR